MKSTDKKELGCCKLELGTGIKLGMATGLSQELTAKLKPKG